MTLRGYLGKLLGGREVSENVAIYCPLTDGMTDETLIATEETEPDAWIQEDRVALYNCPVCGNRHKFLWGPPTPLYLGDLNGDSFGGDGDENGDSFGGDGDENGDENGHGAVA